MNLIDTPGPGSSGFPNSVYDAPKGKKDVEAPPSPKGVEEVLKTLPFSDTTSPRSKPDPLSFKAKVLVVDSSSNESTSESEAESEDQAAGSAPSSLSSSEPDPIQGSAFKLAEVNLEKSAAKTNTVSRGIFSRIADFFKALFRYLFSNPKSISEPVSSKAKESEAIVRNPKIETHKLKPVSKPAVDVEDEFFDAVEPPPALTLQTASSEVKSHLADFAAHLAVTKGMYNLPFQPKSLIQWVLSNKKLIPHIIDQAIDLIKIHFIGVDKTDLLKNCEKDILASVGTSLQQLREVQGRQKLPPGTPKEEIEAHFARELRKKNQLHPAIFLPNAEELKDLARKGDIIRSDYSVARALEELKRTRDGVLWEQETLVQLDDDIRVLERLLALEEKIFKEEQKHLRSISKQILNQIYPSGLPFYLSNVPGVTDFILGLTDRILFQAVEVMSHPGTLYDSVNEFLEKADQPAPAQTAPISPVALPKDEPLRLEVVIFSDEAARLAFPDLFGKGAQALERVISGFVAKVVPRLIQTQMDGLRKNLTERLQQAGDAELIAGLQMVDEKLFLNGKMRELKPDLTQDEMKLLREKMDGNLQKLIKTAAPDFAQDMDLGNFALGGASTILNVLGMQTINKSIVYGLLDSIVKNLSKE